MKSQQNPLLSRRLLYHRRQSPRLLYELKLSRRLLLCFAQATTETTLEDILTTETTEEPTQSAVESSTPVPPTAEPTIGNLELPSRPLFVLARAGRTLGR
jgi:hypothetical protein